MYLFIVAGTRVRIFRMKFNTILQNSIQEGGPFRHAALFPEPRGAVPSRLIFIGFPMKMKGGYGLCGTYRDSLFNIFERLDTCDSTS